MSVKILVGDVRDMLRTLADNSVDCVVTSPPYWGLRNYNVEGQIGLEGSLGEHLAVMVDVFREVRRVMKPTATLWLNYGDTYASSVNGRSAADTKAAGNDDRTFRDKPYSTVGPVYVEDPRSPERVGNSSTMHSQQTCHVAGRIAAGGTMKPKDLCLVPHRVAIALWEDGWWIRQDIVWAKPNPMPESISDRCTKSHEYIFLMTKAERYFFDAEAIAEPVTQSTVERMSQEVQDQLGSTRANGNTRQERPMKAVLKSSGNIARKPASERGVPEGTGKNQAGSVPWEGATRNKRSVWTVPAKGFDEAHFATFPVALIEPCILAGTSAHGNCAKCGKPWERVTDVAYENPGNRTTNGPRSTERRHETAGFEQRLEKRTETTGWAPTCKCGTDEVVPATVLDVFAGAFTTSVVADRLGRNSIGIELNEEYVQIGIRRLKADAGFFCEIEVQRGAPPQILPDAPKDEMPLSQEIDSQ